MRFLLFLMMLSPVFSQDILKPGSNDLGTKEDTKLITSLALWYVEIRNTVRDAYNTIQYTKAMINNLESMKEWYERNSRQWKDIGNDMVKLVSEPGRWDEKLQAAEDIFDDIDYQLFDETNNLDYLIYHQERYFGGAVESGQDFLKLNSPDGYAFLKEIKALYTPYPDDVYLDPKLAEDREAAEKFTHFESQRRRERKNMIKKWQSGRLEEATVISTSMALSKIAAVKRIQLQRADRYAELHGQIKNLKGTNVLALKEALNTLFETGSGLDYATLQLVEMELYFHQMGLSIFEATDRRSQQVRTAAGVGRLIDLLRVERVSQKPREAITQTEVF